MTVYIVLTASIIALLSLLETTLVRMTVAGMPKKAAPYSAGDKMVSLLKIGGEVLKRSA